jgi:hypothetical protein
MCSTGKLANSLFPAQEETEWQETAPAVLHPAAQWVLRQDCVFPLVLNWQAFQNDEAFKQHSIN